MLLAGKVLDGLFVPSKIIQEEQVDSTRPLLQGQTYATCLFAPHARSTVNHLPTPDTLSRVLNLHICRSVSRKVIPILEQNSVHNYVLLWAK